MEAEQEATEITWITIIDGIEQQNRGKHQKGRVAFTNNGDKTEKPSK